MAAIHSILTHSATPDLLDARDALDGLGEKLELLRLALSGLRAGGDAVTPRMIDPLLALTTEIQRAASALPGSLG